MSEILSNIVVESSNINITPTDNNINITPESIQLNVYTGSAPIAGGSNTQVQYNDNGALAGSSTFTFDNTTNTVTTSKLITTSANLGSVSNVKITGGTNGYVLQTDGTGNLSWTAQTGNGGGNGTPGGSNTQIQFNDGGVFGGSSGFTFDKTTNAMSVPGNLSVAGTIIGTIANANYANYAGDVVNANQPNITAVGTLANLTVNGTTSSNVFSASGNIITYSYYLGDGGLLANIVAYNLGNGNSNVIIPSFNGPIIANVNGVANVMVLQSNLITFGQDVSMTGNMAVGNLTATTANLTGNLNAANANLGNSATANYFSGNGYLITGVLTSNFANYAGNVTVSSQPNITSVGTLTGLTVNGVSNLGAIGNVKITGGTASQFIQTDGTGNLSFGTVNTSSISNGNSSVSIPVANGNIRFTAGGNLIATAQPNGYFDVNTVTRTTNIIVTNPDGSGGSGQISFPAGSIRINAANGGYGNNQTIINYGFGGNAANSIAIGGSNSFGGTLGQGAIAIGVGAGASGVNSIAIGGIAANLETVSIGYSAGVGSADRRAVFLGGYTGYNSNVPGQIGAVAIGWGAGALQSANSIAIGYLAGNTRSTGEGIAIGAGAGLYQGDGAIAIGARSGGNGKQGFNSIAIGRGAGGTSNAIANNSILLDAVGGTENIIANSFVVKPIRDVTGVPGFTVQLYYNPTTGEIGYK